MDNNKKRRSTAGLFLDFWMTIFTGGAWIVWMVIRYLRKKDII